MRTRTSTDQLAREAESALLDALAGFGLRPDVASGDGADLEVIVSDGRRLRIDVKGVSTPTIDRVQALTEHRRADATVVVVADQVSAAVREELNLEELSWFDRRGHIRFVAPGVFIDADVPPSPRASRTRDTKREPIAGRSGLAAAAALLMQPSDPMTVAETARAAQLNESSISRALATLHDAHLALRIGRGRYEPLVPELFWALADVWPRDSVEVALVSLLDHGVALRLERDDVASPGWAAAGVPAAIAWGAPLVATADSPMHLYAPDERLVRRAAALDIDDRGRRALVSVDPTGLITAQRLRVHSVVLPVAHPLFCALDLTAASRDREALEQWTPPEGFTRVW